MTVIGCQSFGRTFSNERNRQTGSRTYNVWSDVRVDLDEVLQQATFIPQIGDAWGASGASGPQGLVAVRQTPIEVNKEQKFYKIQVDYETDDSYSSNWNVSLTTVKINYVPWRTKTAYNEAPTSIFDSTQYLGPAGYGGDEDAFGYPIINRAKDPFEPSLTDTRYASKLTLKRVFRSLASIQANVPSPDMTIDSIDSLMSWRGVMNTSLIQIAGIIGDAWTFKIDDISCARLPRADGSYDTEVTFVIIHDPRSHAQVALNSGYNQIIDGTTTKRAIRDASGNKTVGMLGPQGEYLDSWTFPAGVTGPEASVDGPPYYIVFPLLEQRYFGDLDLPVNWGD